MAGLMDRIRDAEIDDTPAWAKDTITPEAHAQHSPVDLRDAIEMIPRANIERWQRNPRGEVKEEHVKEFRDELLKRRERGEGIDSTGIEEYLKVRPHEKIPNKYILIEGERRWKATEGTVITHLPCMVHHISEGEALTMAISLDKNRQEWGVLGECFAYLHYKEGVNPEGKEKGYREVAADFGISPGEMNNRLRIVKPNEKLPPKVGKAICADLQHMVSERPDSVSHAEHLVKVRSDGTRKRLVQKVIDGMSVAALKSEVDNITAPPPSHRKAPPPSHSEPRPSLSIVPSLPPRPAYEGITKAGEYNPVTVSRSVIGQASEPGPDPEQLAARMATLAAQLADAMERSRWSDVFFDSVIVPHMETTRAAFERIEKKRREKAA